MLLALVSGCHEQKLAEKVLFRLSSHNDRGEARIGAADILPLNLLGRIQVLKLSLNAAGMHYKAFNRCLFGLHACLNEEFGDFIAL
jgi:hypothetical protein